MSAARRTSPLCLQAVCPGCQAAAPAGNHRGTGRAGPESPHPSADRNDRQGCAREGLRALRGKWARALHKTRRSVMAKIILVNPAMTTVGYSVITPRWLFVLAQATPVGLVGD